MPTSPDMAVRQGRIWECFTTFIAKQQLPHLHQRAFATRRCFAFGQIVEVLNWRRTSKLGGGIYIGHAYNITINCRAIIGRNCNIHKGVVIGQVNRGPRKGYPTIGDRVWIGINSAIVGKVTIGDDVLIAPNSFVNVDIPSHSVVFGNPCVIKHRDWATEDYVNNIVE